MTTPEMQGGRLIRASELAKILAVAPRTVYLCAQRGEIPCVRINRALRFDPVAIRRWIRDGGTAGAK